ncbi:MAG: tyrosine-type recombinase/integrase [Candidatus Fimimorpha sp.]
MLNDIKKFLLYLKEQKKVSHNTELSYERDLRYFTAYLNQEGIMEWRKVTATAVQSYMIFLEKEGKSAATISRMFAALRAFFYYALCEHIVEEDPTRLIHHPKVEKKQTEIMTEEEIERLLRQPSKRTPKELRDRAILQLLYATDLKVTEIISLKISDLNMTFHYITSRQRKRSIPFDLGVKEALNCYLIEARPQLVKEEGEPYLFLSCLGKPMSRQGVWKLLKAYAREAGISKEITSRTLRYSFEASLNAAN